MARLRTVPLALWVLIAAGTAIRLALAFATHGTATDITAAELVGHELRDGNPFDVYGDIPVEGAPTWPYPPGFFPFIGISGALAGGLPGPFHGWIQLGPILADAVLAVVVQQILLARGHGPRVQLAGAAMVAAGPLFGLVSGVTFQIDAVAVIPALLGVVAWDMRSTAGHRALVAGLLIGVAATVKSPLGLAVVALLPTARDRREGAVALGAAVAVPLACLVPFLIGDARGTIDNVLGHVGAAGQAMLGAVVHPELTRSWVTGDWSGGYRNDLEPIAPLLLGLVLAGVLALGFRRRPAALALALVLWPAIWIFGSGFYFHYLLWGLPFFLAAGRLWEAAAIQALGAAAMLRLTTGPAGELGLAAYRGVIYVLLLVTLVVLFRSAQRTRST